LQGQAQAVSVSDTDAGILSIQEISVQKTFFGPTLAKRSVYVFFKRRLDRIPSLV